MRFVIDLFENHNNNNRQSVCLVIITCIVLFVNFLSTNGETYRYNNYNQNDKNNNLLKKDLLKRKTYNQRYFNGNIIKRTKGRGSSRSSRSTITSGGILWEDLVVATHDVDPVVLLKPCSGYVPRGHVCGVLGPSGSGKTTLLSAIAGRPQASLRIDGHVLHYDHHNNEVDSSNNESDDDDFKNLHSFHGEDYKYYCFPVVPDTVAWLQQQDAFFELLTVQETLDVAVFLDWPHLSRKERDNISFNCLEFLGLARLKHRQIGNPNNARTSDGGPTLSGGELRRLSVALELVTNPCLFIADEPLTGIDSKMSEHVFQAILSLAQQRHLPCFCTLHQPRSSIWHMLDFVIIMAAGGRICYFGPRQECTSYFSSLGFPCPEETNPAEFFVDLVSVDLEDQFEAAQDRARIDRLANAFEERNNNLSKNLRDFRRSAPLKSVQRRDPCTSASQVAFTSMCSLRRFGALVRRSWRQTIRSYSLNFFRLVASIGTALLLSQIFPSVVRGPPTNRSVSDRMCLLSYGVINMFMISIMKTIGIFAKEKSVVQREKIRNYYTSLEYIMSKAFAEIPLDMVFAVVFATTLKVVTGLAIDWKQISSVFAVMTVSGASLGFLLGSIVKSKDAATAIAMPVLILLMVVGVINPSGVDSSKPNALLVEFVKSLSPIASAIEALSVAEFSGVDFASRTSLFGLLKLREAPRMGALAFVSNGDEVLDVLGLKGVQFNAVMAHMVALSFLNFGLCWLGLYLTNDIRVSRLWINNIRSFLSRRKRKYISRQNSRADPRKTHKLSKSGQQTCSFMAGRF